jgi:hypothetical protein
MDEDAIVKTAADAKAARLDRRMLVRMIAPPRKGLGEADGQTPIVSSYSGEKLHLLGEMRDGCARDFPAGVTLPLVTDLAALDKLGHNRSHHPFVTLRAAQWRGDTAAGGKGRTLGMKSHGSGLLESSVPLRDLVPSHHGSEETLW